MGLARTEVPFMQAESRQTTPDLPSMPTVDDSRSPTRPALRYHGGKWRLAPWIIAYFPPHKIYVEPFGGAASVLLRKPRSRGEVYNDLDDDVVNFFRVLQDEQTAQELCRLATLTPYARTEFADAYLVSDDAVTRALRLLIRSFMGFSSASCTRAHRGGFRSNSNRSGSIPATDWSRWPQQVKCLVERLRGVVIENRPATEVIAQHDSSNTLHYVDPPYVLSARSSLQRKGGTLANCYNHEMTDDDHACLARTLRSCAGMVVLSGYETELYCELYSGWRSVLVNSYASGHNGAVKRTECLWTNERAQEGMRQMGLFPAAGAAS